MITLKDFLINRCGYDYGFIANDFAYLIRRKVEINNDFTFRFDDHAVAECTGKICGYNFGLLMSDNNHGEGYDKMNHLIWLVTHNISYGHFIRKNRNK